MVTFAQAQERAEEWVNGDVPAYQHREVRVREFELGFVVWAEDRPDGPVSDGGRQRLVIARDSGEATLWPGLPVGEVIRRYEEEYGSQEEEPAAPAPPERVDLNQTSFLLSPPEWLQEAADKLGIPDRRAERDETPPPAPRAPSSFPPPAPIPSPSAPSQGGSVAYEPTASDGVPASSLQPPVGATPWAGTDVNADSDDAEVALPATVFAPPLSGADDEEELPPVVPADAPTALMSGGSALPKTAIAPSLGGERPPVGPPVPGPPVPGTAVPGPPPPGQHTPPPVQHTPPPAQHTPPPPLSAPRRPVRPAGPGTSPTPRRARRPSRRAPRAGARLRRRPVPPAPRVPGRVPRCRRPRARVRPARPRAAMCRRSWSPSWVRPAPRSRPVRRRRRPPVAGCTRRPRCSPTRTRRPARASRSRPARRVCRVRRSRPVRPESRVRPVGSSRLRRRGRRRRPVRAGCITRRRCSRGRRRPVRARRSRRVRPVRRWVRRPRTAIRRRRPVSRPWVRAIRRCCASGRRTAVSSS